MGGGGQLQKNKYEIKNCLKKSTSQLGIHNNVRQFLYLSGIIQQFLSNHIKLLVILFNCYNHNTALFSDSLAMFTR